MRVQHKSITTDSNRKFPCKHQTTMGCSIIVNRMDFYLFLFTVIFQSCIVLLLKNTIYILMFTHAA